MTSKFRCYVPGVPEKMSVCELDSLLTNGHPVVSEFFIWAVKDSSIGSVFVDPGAGEFLLKRLHEGKSE